MAVVGTQACKTLEKSLITPHAEIEQTLPLTFLDVGFVHFYQSQRLLFYKFPCSKSRFLGTIVPSFKTSLSKTLKHYLPLSGNLYYPDPTHDAGSSLPEIRYKPGDSVSLTVAELASGEDGSEEYFNHLTRNFQRDCDKFYAFVTDLPDPRSEPGFQIIPLLAVKITLFPGVGICLGFTNHHVAGDENTIVGFIKAWSRVSKFGEDHPNIDFLLPVYDRSLLKDPKDLKNLFWNQMKHRAYQPRPSIPPKDKVRATYVLQEFHIQQLKTTVRTKKLHLTHVSSFTIATAYAWTCLAKSSSSEQVRDDEPEHFSFPVDARARVDPLLPPNYFGNCLGVSFVETTHADLKGEDGFITAAELISDVISNVVIKKGEILKDAENWPRKAGNLVGKRYFSVTGSPKFDLYVADFGWGKPIKYEALSINLGISLSRSGEFEGGLEIGLALPKEKMDAFAEYFYGGLEIYGNS